MKILTWNSDYVFNIQSAVHTVKGDNSKCILSELCPFFDLHFLSSIKHSTMEHWRPHAVLLFSIFIL